MDTEAAQELVRRDKADRAEKFRQELERLQAELRCTLVPSVQEIAPGVYRAIVQIQAME